MLKENYLSFALSILLCFTCLFNAYTKTKVPDPLEIPPKQPFLAKFKKGFGQNFQSKFIDSNGKPNNKAIAETTWSSASECFGLEGMSLTTLENLKVPQLENINKVLTEIGLGAAVAQLTIDVFLNKKPYIGTLNFLKSFSLYKLGKSSSKLLSAASLAISFIDYSLTKFATTAFQIQKTKWSETFYNYYNNSGMGGKLDYEGWKNLLQNAKNAEDVQRIACDYLNKFWTNVDEDTLRHFVPDKYTDFTKQFPVPEEQQKITEEYFKYVMAPKLRTYLYKMAKEKAEEQYNAEMLKLRKLLNTKYRLQITLKGPNKLLKLRLPYKFGPWINRTNYNGEDVFRFNLYSFLKAGSPDKVIVALSKKDRITAKLPKPSLDNHFMININILTKIDTRVLDKETNKPVPGVRLVIHGVSFYDKSLIPGIKSIMPKNPDSLGKIPQERYYCQKIISDKYGQLLLGEIPAGIYTIELSADGYNPLKYEKIRLYTPVTKPFYLTRGMNLGINLQADKMVLTSIPQGLNNKPYIGKINILIDVANFRSKIDFDVAREYYHMGAIGGARISKNGNITYGGGNASDSYPCKYCMKAEGWCDMKRLYKLATGKYEFKTALIKFKPTTLEYKYKGQEPVVSTPHRAESLLKSSFSGIIDLNKGTVKGVFGRGDSGPEFNGTVKIISTEKEKTKQELFQKIDELLKDKKQAKKLTREERKKIMKKISKGITNILRKAN